MKIGKYRIIKEEEYQELKRILKYWNEREAIIKDNSIQKEKEELEIKYKKYFGRYYETDDGIIFRIDGIYYDRYSYGWNKFPGNFKFSTSAPNYLEWDYDVEINDIVENKIKEVKNPKLI